MAVRATYRQFPESPDTQRRLCNSLVDPTSNDDPVPTPPQRGQRLVVARRFSTFQPPIEPTARAITSKVVSRAAVASTPMNTLARVESGMVSVGLKALELVSER